VLVGLLGLQGAFLDHREPLSRLGVPWLVVKDASALARVDRLILPGGESTVMGRFLHQYSLTEPLRERLRQGMPAWGICAGAILLATVVDGARGVLATMDVDVVRNAYGRQAASDIRPIDVPALDLSGFPATFIRAPRVTRVGAAVEVLARRGDDPVFLRQGRMVVTTFHPELSNDDAVHRWFVGS